MLKIKIIGNGGGLNAGLPYKNVHTSIDEVLEKGLPISGNSTTYYGAHLVKEFGSPHPAIVCVKPGAEIVVVEKIRTSNNEQEFHTLL